MVDGGMKRGMRNAECGRWTPVLDDPGGVAEISWGLRAYP
jgi:hypothetical protein